MRLIDADNVISLITNHHFDDDKKNFDLLIHNLCKEVRQIPTAYDVDKVVEQLENERELSYADFDRYVEEVSPTLDDEYDDFFHKGLERAIRVVKGGGVDV